MAEYELNQLTTGQLIALVHQGGTFVAATREAKFETELYYVAGHFVEISYVVRKGPDGEAKRQVYVANHFPDCPSNTKYLLMYLDQITLPK